MMTFSVVIAAYEAASTVGRAIESALAQTREDFEVIVIDDGSRDDTAAVGAKYAAKDARVSVHSQPNGGPSAARNKGIALSSARYVSMLDSDDLWLPEYLAQMGAALDREPDAGFAYTEAWELNEASGRFLKPTTMARQHPPQRTLPQERFLSELMQRNFVYNAVTVRRSVLEQVGGYDPGMTHGEDYELWLRIATSGFNAVRVPGPLAIKRDSPSSLSYDHTAMDAGVREAYRAVLERHPASARVRELAVARLDELSEAERRQASRKGRVLLAARRALAGATRAQRRRLQQRSEPPPGVAEAFPGLGLGEGGRRRRTQ